MCVLFVRGLKLIKQKYVSETQFPVCVHWFVEAETDLNDI
jgi:hypothetical protein